MAALLDVAGVTVEPEQAAPEKDVAALDAALADAALAAAEPEAAPVDADADPFAFPPLDEEERPFLTDALVACHDSCAASKDELDAREASWGAEAPIYETSYGDGCELEVHFRQLEDRAIEFKFRCALPASPRNVLALAKEADLAPRWNSWVASAASLSDRAVGPRNFQLRRQIAINFPYPLPQPALTVRLSFHEDLGDSGNLVACVLNEPSKLGPVALGWAAVNGFARGAPVAADRSSWTVAQRVNVPGFFPMWLVTFFGRFVVRIFAPRIFEIVKKTARRPSTSRAPSSTTGSTRTPTASTTASSRPRSSRRPWSARSPPTSARPRTTRPTAARRATTARRAPRTTPRPRRTTKAPSPKPQPSL